MGIFNKPELALKAQLSREMQAQVTSSAEMTADCLKELPSPVHNFKPGVR